MNCENNHSQAANHDYGHDIRRYSKHSTPNASYNMGLMMRANCPEFHSRRLYFSLSKDYINLTPNWDNTPIFACMKWLPLLSFTLFLVGFVLLTGYHNFTTRFGLMMLSMVLLSKAAMSLLKHSRTQKKQQTDIPDAALFI